MNLNRTRDAHLEPGRNDVVCGGNKMCQYKGGNMRFRVIIHENMQSYCEASKIGKTTIIANVMALIQSKDGAFIKKDVSSGQYNEIADHNAVSFFEQKS